MATAVSRFDGRFFERDTDRSDRVVADLRPLARPLDGDRDLDPLLGRIGDARVVLLGEASHGTHEFYAWRSRITRRLIEEKGFDFVAVEGDWPDFERLNRFVRGRGDERFAPEVLRTFHRWPTWMWANEDVAELCEWMRGHNERAVGGRQVGIHGLDVYSLWESMESVVRYLDGVDPAAAREARRAYECFAPYDNEAEGYALATRIVPVTCEGAVVRALTELRSRAPMARADGDERERYFVAEQNAIVARNAERYYRTMIGSGPESWNIRDRHMGETLDRLLAFYEGQGHGPSSKAIVWAHNTHIGDARHTDMVEDGETNLGQIARETYGDRAVVLVGFTTHSGTVCAGDAWGSPMETMIVPPGREGSFEDILHRVGARDALYLLGGARQPTHGGSAPVHPGSLLEPRGHRAIGVVYRPGFERYGNYVPTVLPRRYDAMLFLDETRALRPLKTVHTGAPPPCTPESERVLAGPDAPETYPTGM